MISFIGHVAEKKPGCATTTTFVDYASSKSTPESIYNLKMFRLNMLFLITVSNAMYSEQYHLDACECKTQGSICFCLPAAKKNRATVSNDKDNMRRGGLVGSCGHHFCDKNFHL